TAHESWLWRGMRRHIVLARAQAGDPELSQIVRLAGLSRGDATRLRPASNRHWLEGRDRDVRQRLAPTIQDTPADGTATTQSNIRTDDALPAMHVDVHAGRASRARQVRIAGLLCHQ